MEGFIRFVVSVVSIFGICLLLCAQPSLVNAANPIHLGSHMNSLYGIYKNQFNLNSIMEGANSTRSLTAFVNSVTTANFMQRENPHASFGWTPFSDMEDSYFKRTRINYKPSSTYFSSANNTAPLYLKEYISSLPASFDWKDHGAVTAVKDQKDCGGCWAFSAIANIEGQWVVRGGQKLVALSEQQLISCDDYFPCMGCSSGEQSCAWEYLVSEAGGNVATEESYPYASASGNTPSCSSGKIDNGAVVTGQVTISSDEDQMAAYLYENGPISVAAYALPWKTYVSGVVTSNCSGDVDHAVVITGFGVTSDGVKYWNVKNSWGPQFGEGGYVRVQRGVAMCNINHQVNSSVVGSKVH